MTFNRHVDSLALKTSRMLEKVRYVKHQCNFKSNFTPFTQRLMKKRFMVLHEGKGLISENCEPFN